jgi:transcriptional regulator with XRE-family HTH domain
MLLRKIRKEYNLTQVELGKILQVSPVQVSRLETGESQLSLAEFGRLKKALDLNAEYFEKLITYAMETDVPRKRKKTK